MKKHDKACWSATHLSYFAIPFAETPAPVNAFPNLQAKLVTRHWILRLRLSELCLVMTTSNPVCCYFWLWLYLCTMTKSIDCMTNIPFSRPYWVGHIVLHAYLQREPFPPHLRRPCWICRPFMLFIQRYARTNSPQLGKNGSPRQWDRSRP